MHPRWKVQKQHTGFSSWNRVDEMDRRWMFSRQGFSVVRAHNRMRLSNGDHHCRADCGINSERFLSVADQTIKRRCSWKVPRTSQIGSSLSANYRRWSSLPSRVEETHEVGEPSHGSTTEAYFRSSMSLGDVESGSEAAYYDFMVIIKCLECHERVLGRTTSEWSPSHYSRMPNASLPAIVLQMSAPSE